MEWFMWQTWRINTANLLLVRFSANLDSFQLFFATFFEILFGSPPVEERKNRESELGNIRHYSCVKPQKQNCCADGPPPLVRETIERYFQNRQKRVSKKCFLCTLHIFFLLLWGKCYYGMRKKTQRGKYIYCLGLVYIF